MLGVSLRTAQLWVENGNLDAWKTEGGHRRIHRGSVERLISRSAPIRVRPSDEKANPLNATRAQAGGAPVVSKAEPPAERPLNILVVEDDFDLCRLYRLTVTRWPIKTRLRISANIFEALVLIGQDPPDLLISGLRMPSVQADCCMFRELHELPFLHGMMMVAINVLSNAELELERLLPPDIPVLPKPIPSARGTKRSRLRSPCAMASCARGRTELMPFAGVPT